MLNITTEQPKRDAILTALDRIEDTVVRVRCRSSSVRARLAGHKNCGHVWDDSDVREMREKAATARITIICPVCTLGHVVGPMVGRPGLWIGALL